MKKIILSLCFSGCFLLSYSQNSNTFHPILNECITYCIDSLPKIWLTFKVDYIVGDKYPYYFKITHPEVDNIQFVTLLSSSMLSLPVKRKMQKIFSKKEGVYEGASVMMYNGIDLVQDTLKVSFLFPYVYRTKKIFNIAMSNGVNFYYCYYPQEGKWVCVRKERW